MSMADEKASGNPAPEVEEEFIFSDNDGDLDQGELKQ